MYLDSWESRDALGGTSSISYATRSCSPNYRRAWTHARCCPFLKSKYLNRAGFYIHFLRVKCLNDTNYVELDCNQNRIPKNDLNLSLHNHVKLCCYSCTYNLHTSGKIQFIVIIIIIITIKVSLTEERSKVCNLKIYLFLIIIPKQVKQAFSA